MDVWVLECQVPSECDSNFTVWDSEEEARKQACIEIQDGINDSWFRNQKWLSKEKMEAAKEINEHVAAGRWHKAILCWNNSVENVEADDSVYWNVTQREVFITHADDPHVFASTDFDSDDSESSKSDCNDCDGCGCSKPFVATVSGAKCRKCPHVSEYAYADKEDGTFICRSCKMMMDVFTPGD